MRSGSAIINTASVNSFNPEEELLDYASTKGAIAIFTRALAKQVAKPGIRVNAAAPGPIWTPLQVAGGQLPGEMGKFGQHTPLGRAGQPAELAPLHVTQADPRRASPAAACSCERGSGDDLSAPKGKVSGRTVAA